MPQNVKEAQGLPKIPLFPRLQEAKKVEREVLQDEPKWDEQTSQELTQETERVEQSEVPQGVAWITEVPKIGVGKSVVPQRVERVVEVVLGL